MRGSRERLEVLQLADRAPVLGSRRYCRHEREIGEKLCSLDEELHDLDVQLIREGVSSELR